MRTWIIFLMVCWLSITSCFGEWTSSFSSSQGEITNGNVSVGCWGWGWALCIYSPGGKYINGVRYVYQSGVSKVGVRFMNEGAGFNNWSSEEVLINEKWIDPVVTGTLYTVMSDLPCQTLLIGNGDWNGHTAIYVEVDIKAYEAEMPTITPPGGIVPPETPITITSSQTRDGATISYTRDGTENWKPYADGLILLTEDATIKAVAYYKGLTSPINTKTFQIGYMPPIIDPPGATFNKGVVFDVTITNNPANKGYGTVQFRHNDDGSANESSWTNYTGPLEISADCVIEARVVGTIRTSEIAKETYKFVVAQVEPVNIMPIGGNMPQTQITMTCATPGATIYYAINGAPSRSSLNYTEKGPFYLEINVPVITDMWDKHKPADEDQFSTSARVSAFAIKEGWTDSIVTSRVYVTGDNLPTSTKVLPDDKHQNVQPDGSITSGGKTYTLPDYGDYVSKRGDLLDQYNAATTQEERDALADQIFQLDLAYYGGVNEYYYVYNLGSGGTTTGGGTTTTGGTTTGGTTTSTIYTTSGNGTTATVTTGGEQLTGNELLLMGGAAAGTTMLPSMMNNSNDSRTGAAPANSGNNTSGFSQKVYFTK